MLILEAALNSLALLHQFVITAKDVIALSEV